MTDMPEMDEMPPDAPTPEMSDVVRAQLLGLFREVMGENKTARRAEFRTAWEQRSFADGVQHLWYDASSYTFMSPKSSGRELPRYMDVYNIYTPHRRSFVSILGQPTGTNFVPTNLQESNDVTAAQYAEKMRHRVDRLVPIREHQAEAASFLCTDGRTMTRVYVDRDGKLCVGVYGVLESKVPIFIRTMAKWSYCVLSEETDIWEEKAEWPDYADEIDSGSSSSADASYERIGRLNVIADRRGGGVAESMKSLATRHIAWIRPSRYGQCKDEGEEYLEQFADGVRLTIIGDVLVECVAEKMEDALRVQWPTPGKGQKRPSLLQDLVSLQRTFNDYKNNLRESADYVNAATWIDGSALDSEAVPEQQSQPGAIHVMNPPGQKTMADCVFQEAGGTLSPELIAACEQIMQLAEFTTGDLPSLYGSGTPDQETASGQKMLSDQAKGQLSTAWNAIQWLFAGVYELAVRQAAKLVADQPMVAVQGPNGQESFSPSKILDGSFGCYPSSDSSYPESMADRRASLQMTLPQLDPSIANHPDNLKLVQQYSGLTDLVIPAAKARDKQLREIEQLLQEPPVPDMAMMQQAMSSGQQMDPNAPPMKSSVPVDETWDFHQFEIDKLQEWLSTTAAYEEARKGNLSGLQNVKLHGVEHQAALAKLAQASQKPQQTPMSISGSFKDLDAATKVQVLQRDGYQPDGSAFEADAVQAQQASAAKTSHTAAQAQHQGVLAAKEAVGPVKTAINTVAQMPTVRE